jgi:hypothetical protein
MCWFRHGGVMLALLAVVAVVVAGCGQGNNKPGQVARGKSVKKADADSDAPAAAKGDTRHEDWWCAEHGIPEDECSLCSARAAQAFKDKGDWCDKHNRALSQCFLCKPERKEFYAAKYRAKYGKEPPPIEEESEKK